MDLQGEEGCFDERTIWRSGRDSIRGYGRANYRRYNYRRKKNSDRMIYIEC